MMSKFVVNELYADLCAHYFNHSDSFGQIVLRPNDFCVKYNCY